MSNADRHLLPASIHAALANSALGVILVAEAMSWQGRNL
jgi:hypothetical protein